MGSGMADLRLNGVIRALEAGRPAFTCFSVPEVDSAYAVSVSKFDGVVFEMEHNPWDGRALRDALQYMLNRAQIVKAGNNAPAVTPMVRVPVNGVEKAQWQAKQALDLGCYGIVFPHISTVEEAYNAVAACRHPRRRPDRRGALLGPDAAGLLQEGRRLAARSERRDLRDPADRGHARRRQPRRHAARGEGHRRHSDRRRRSRAGARHPAPIRASRSAEADGARGRELQEAQRHRRPSACRIPQCRAKHQGGLSLPDVWADAQLRPPRQGAADRGNEVITLVMARESGASSIRRGCDIVRLLS